MLTQRTWVMAAGRNFAFKIAAKPLQIKIQNLTKMLLMQRKVAAASSSVVCITHITGANLKVSALGKTTILLLC